MKCLPERELQRCIQLLVIRRAFANLYVCGGQIRTGNQRRQLEKMEEAMAKKLGKKSLLQQQKPQLNFYY